MCSAKCFTNPDQSNWSLIKENYPSLWNKMINYGLKEKLSDLYTRTKDKRIKKAIDYSDIPFANPSN